MRSEKMNIIHNAHDGFFKDSLTDLKVAREFFQQHLPMSVQKFLDFDTLQLQSGSYVDQALKQTASDILYKVNYKDSLDSAYLYILAEHQSSVDMLMPFRVLRYIVSIWTQHLKKHKGTKLPLVIPLVFYNGSQEYDGPRDIPELIEAPLELIELFLFKPFHLIDAQAISDEELREKYWAGLMTYVMKHVRTREALNCVKTVLALANRIVPEDGSSFVTSTLNYFLSQTQTADPSQLFKAVKMGLAEEGNIMSTVAEYLVAQHRDIWLETGIQQGVKQGVQQGESTVLILLLEQKFKRIPAHYRQKIKQASQANLLKWAGKVLTSNTLEEVFMVSPVSVSDFVT